MKLCVTNPARVCAVHRRALLRRIGFFSHLSGWAQHIVDRWRNAACKRPTAPHATEIGLASDELFSVNLHRAVFHGMHVPGA